MIFSLHEALLWILARDENFKLKHPFVSYKHSFSLLKTLTGGLEWCGIIVMFLLDSHSDGTHSLTAEHPLMSDVMLHFSKSDEETNSSTSWTFSAYLHFWVNYSFKSQGQYLTQ